MSVHRKSLLQRAALWLLLLGPFFYLSYGLSNWWASTRVHVPAVVFDWEHHIPFLAWTIFPYWSLNLIYAGSLFLGRSAHAIDRHALRLLTAQIIATSCFVLWPLHISFPKPPVDGLAGALFDALTSFDKPYNQAPSLHIALSVILWDWCRQFLRTRWARAALLVWMLLIGASVLTTRQHHFIDIPTGALLGLLCVWLWPLERRASMRQVWRFTQDARRRKLGALYALGAALCLTLALSLGPRWPWLLWLAWPAASLALVALCYFGLGARGFAMDRHGQMHWAARWLYAPYRLGARINAWCWTRRLPIASRVLGGAAQGQGGEGEVGKPLGENGEARQSDETGESGEPEIWLARLPRAGEWQSAGQPLLVSLCAELQAPHPGHDFTRDSACGSARDLAHKQGKVQALPLLDLVTPTPAQLRRAAHLIESQYRRAQRSAREGPPMPAVWICCALGFSRSAASLMAWLLLTGRATSVDAAETLLRRARPVVLSPEVRQVLVRLVEEVKEDGMKVDGMKEGGLFPSPSGRAG